MIIVLKTLDYYVQIVIHKQIHMLVAIQQKPLNQSSDKHSLFLIAKNIFARSVAKKLIIEINCVENVMNKTCRVVLEIHQQEKS